MDPRNTAYAAPELIEWAPPSEADIAAIRDAIERHRGVRITSPQGCRITIDESGARAIVTLEGPKH